MKKATFILVLIFFIITNASAQKTGDNSENAVSLETLIRQKRPTYVITNEHLSKTSGIRHVYLRQALNGLTTH
jgi:extracellular elastinolytic metalloproteinase